MTATATGEGQPETNNPPAVTVSFPTGNTCAPSLATPCTVDVVAQATDADGDALRYSWSGCASGSDTRARCTIAAPGQIAATVTVDDQRGHVVSGSASATGTNGLPDVSIGYIALLPTSQVAIDILGGIHDPEDGFLCGQQYCGGLTVSGACGGGTLQCTCLGDLEILLHRTATTGVCSITVEVKDKWGAVGKPTVTFDVSTLKVLSHTPPSIAASKHE